MEINYMENYNNEQILTANRYMQYSLKKVE